MSRPQLDLVFCCDCTGSMGSYLRSAQDNIKKISDELLATEQRDLRYALVCYRDYPPQDRTYVTRTFDFTNDIAEMKRNVDTMAASGGGDGPEAVTAGMLDVLNLSFREDAVKICILIADAPPHGIGAYGDGFPNGGPDGQDPIQIARQMRDRRIILYTVGCEPSLGGYNNARDFFRAVAEITTGKAISLTDAMLLPKVIIGGAEEEISMDKLSLEVEKQRRSMKMADPTLSDDEIIRRVTLKLAEENQSVRSLLVDKQVDAPNFDCFTTSENLEQAREKLKSRPNTTVNTGAPSLFRPFHRVKRGAVRPAKATKKPFTPKPVITKTTTTKTTRTRKGRGTPTTDTDPTHIASSPTLSSSSSTCVPHIGVYRSPYVPKVAAYYSATRGDGTPLRRSGRIMSIAMHGIRLSSPCASPSPVSSPMVAPRTSTTRRTRTTRTATKATARATRRVATKAAPVLPVAVSSPVVVSRVASSSGPQTVLLDSHVVTHEEVARIYERNTRKYGDGDLPMAE